MRTTRQAGLNEAARRAVPTETARHAVPTETADTRVTPRDMMNVNIILFYYLGCKLPTWRLVLP